MSRHFVSVPLCLKCLLQAIPCLPLREPPPLPLRFHGTLGCIRVPAVQVPPGDRHIASGAPWVGEVYLLQNDNGVEDIPVQEVNLHCRLCRRSARASLHRAAPRASLRRECHSEIPRPSPRFRGSPSLSCLCHPPMLSHQMTFQESHRHQLSALPA